MNRAQEYWRASGALAEQCLEHPFVQGIGDGGLPREQYRYFVGQDAFFLESFARAYAACLARAPDRDGLYQFYDLLGGVFDELRLHRNAAAQLDIDLAAIEPARATLAYTGFLQDAAVSGQSTLGEILAALTPCMRLYAFLGQSLARTQRPEEPLYAEWIDTYASDEFEALASTLETLLNSYGTATERERENYLRAMQLELDFFEAAWGGAD